ncbi:mandelate racemase/muconate lactonizing enzyme family protein [Lysobacter korlensis]|uniref:Mandelate racemase/muconate lactonizing enzyme family protein n=1 Tax=Lysobacter korlensis TaxID=553636 RepID=A0ABV6RT99_9GAMM
MTITGLAVRRIRLPLSRPWGADVRHVTVLAVDVTTSDGDTGHGFSWTPSIGASAVQAMLEEDISGFVTRRDPDPEQLWDPLWRHLHEAGGGGITTIAMAGVDLALWDLVARRRGESVVDALGRRQPTAEVYGSGVNLHYPLDELCRQAERWVAAGYGAAKMKVGRPDLAEDVERVAAVRGILGPDRRLMIDANQRWDLDTAIRALAELRAFDPAWIEEPLRADDLASHRILREATDVPLALGENLHTRYRFAEFFEAGVVQFAQPNVVRVGGITPFLRIARDAEAAGVKVAPHLLFELSGQLALTLPHPALVENVEDASFSDLGALAEDPPVTVTGGELRFTSKPGLGIRFRDDRT